jgi:hypothetical protein
MTGALKNFNFLLAFADDRTLRDIDDAGRQRLVEAIVRAGPSERAWRALLELLASWPDDAAKEEVFTGLAQSLQNWPDEVLAVNSSWTFLYGEDGRMSSLARIVRSIAITHREQYGNRELKAILATPGIGDLRTLVIHKSEIYIQGIVALVLSPYLSRLTTLALESLVLNEDKFDTLFGATNLGRLAKLRLKDVGLNTLRTQRLLDSALIRPVRQLELPYNELDDATAGILAASPKLQELTSLHLQGNLIHAAGRQVLMEKKSADLRIIFE